MSGASSRRVSSALRRAAGISEIDGMLGERSVKDQRSCYHRRTAFMVHGIRQWTAVRSTMCQRQRTILIPSSTEYSPDKPGSDCGDPERRFMLLLLSCNPRISALHCPSARPRHFQAKTLVVHPPADCVARRNDRKMKLAPGWSPERAEDL